MANIYDYLQWRADITFDMHPFNDVDNLILSTLVYLDFDGIVPNEGQDGSVSLRHACKALLRKGGGDISSFMRSFFELDSTFVQLVASSQRFGSTRISSYANIVDKRRALQFAAMQFELPHVGTYVAFRGTDTTLVGWQENLMISFRITAAQEEAARYLERAIMRMGQQEPGIQMLVGGHSKGANLAEYAASCCPAHLQGRITRVYSNDGPGMAPEVMPQSPRQILKDKLRLVVPAYSVVGMIFARTGESRTIVASTGSGIDQHDMTTWQVLRTSLQEVGELSPECMPLNKTLAAWIDSIPLDERERVTNEVFEALQSGGASTFQQIGSSPDGVQQVVRALGNTDERTRKIGLDLLQKILDTSVGAVRTATRRALEDAVRRLRGTKPLRAGIIQTHKNRPGLRVFIDA